jgi:hypothetical protein
MSQAFEAEPRRGVDVSIGVTYCLTTIQPDRLGVVVTDLGGHGLGDWLTNSAGSCAASDLAVVA